MRERGVPKRTITRSNLGSLADAYTSDFGDEARGMKSGVLDIFMGSRSANIYNIKRKWGKR